MRTCKECGCQASVLRIVYVPIRKEMCNICAGIGTSFPKDSLGNRVNVPTGFNKYSYAIDGPITSSRQYAAHLQKEGLAIKGA